MISNVTDSAFQDPLVASDGNMVGATGNESQGKDTSRNEGTTKPVQSEAISVTNETAETDPAALVHHQPSDAETWSFVYAQLARQLEYYFSEKNLSTDTYLQTLRQLNDDCVPVSILANFAMVKRLVMSLTFVIDEEGRLAAVEEAARNYSDRLVVSMIDTKTGKRVPDDGEAALESSSHRILAVGTVDGKPLVLDNSLPQPSPINKTLVLRDVETGVTPEEIHELFNCEGFPPVTCIQPDVANCWFVTLDTEDRSAVLDVLMSLRSMTLHDQPVHARLKSTVVTTVVDTAPVMPWVPPVPGVGDEPVKRKRKKSRGKKKKVGASAAGKKGKNEPAKPALPPPPTLGEENFPTLQDKTVEFDKVPVVEDKGQVRRNSNSSDVDDYEDEEQNEKADDIEDEKDDRKSVKAMSDGASTATTTSSSLESLPKKPTVGYAAALMGKQGGSEGRTDKSSSVSAPSMEAKRDVAKVPEDRPISTSLATKSDAWGGRRSFAEIVRVSQDGVSNTSS